jgi:Cu(I)/Ag(I) efflux system membrane fusion protein
LDVVEKTAAMPANEYVPGRSVGNERHSAWVAVQVVLVRLRFLFLLACVLLVVGAWPTLRSYWGQLTRPTTELSGAMSLNMEYWCPMCPGVVSDWPGKCPVCNMVLVRREKGEPAPLPDGVVARMQFSPYRVQLAGIRTAPVEYRPLRREVVMVGTVVGGEPASALVDAEVFENELPLLAVGVRVEATCDRLVGHVPYSGEVVALEPGPTVGGRIFRVRLKISDPGQELRPGTLVRARAETSITGLEWWRRAAAEAWRDGVAAELSARIPIAQAGPAMPSGVETLLRGAAAEALREQGVGLAIPHSSAIDHGSREVAFVESGPGMFDAVEVTVGPRRGDFYPVLRGVEVGQRVAVAGAFLLDAEMWLNHGLAATYFGATRGASTTPPPPTIPQNRGTLSAADRVLASRQKVCPVTDEPLDSMGGPVRVDVGGRTVFVCCKGCEAPLRKSPEKYLAKLPAK